MKRFFGISLLVCIANAFLYARTPQEAAQIASRFLSQSHSAPEQRMQRVVAAKELEAPVNLVYTHYQADHTTPAIFVFNHSTEEGFVLVSAENNARAVLGYSDYGHLDYTDIPENMQFWFNMYAHEMARSVAVSTTGMQRVGTPINEPLPNIEPILGETTWGQGQPFNNLCPVINGARSVAGCVATAISQIMYAHKHPEKGSGSHSYRIGQEITISEDFSQTIYDWDNMLPSYRKQHTEQEATAVATLIYHTGVASSMSYHPQGSGAVSEWALQAIHTNFGYDAAIKPLLKDYLMESEILKTVASELQEGRPIYVSGRTTKDEGHAFYRYLRQRSAKYRFRGNREHREPPSTKLRQACAWARHLRLSVLLQQSHRRLCSSDRPSVQGDKPQPSAVRFRGGKCPSPLQPPSEVESSAQKEIHRVSDKQISSRATGGYCRSSPRYRHIFDFPHNCRGRNVQSQVHLRQVRDYFAKQSPFRHT